MAWAMSKPDSKTSPADLPLDDAILAVLARAGGKTLSAPEIAHRIAAEDDWHALLTPIRYRVGNILDSQARPERFDLVLCRNVLLYFDETTKERAFGRLASSLREDGWLMLGATPPAEKRDTPEAQAHVMRVTRVFQSAGRHFNRGQRAFFFALGYLGWFLGPIPFAVSTTAIVIVMWRRQFRSASRQAFSKDLG